MTLSNAPKLIESVITSPDDTIAEDKLLEDSLRH
jgi:hypothetical protein